MTEATRPRHLRAVLLLICVAAACAPALTTGHAGIASASEPAVARDLTRPDVEVISESEASITLRFRATERSSAGTKSVLVQVPDAGRIEVESGGIPGADASQFVEVSEPAIMRDIRIVQVVFTPTPEGTRAEDFARGVDVTLRTTAAPGVNERKQTDRALSRAFHDLYKSTVINYDAEAALESLNAQARDGRDPLPFGASYLVISYLSYADEVEPLVEWKNEKGIQSMLVTLATTGSSESQIRSYVQTAYDTWEVPPEFILLVGDTEQLPGYDSMTYTDNYYSAVEGTDYLADIFVGRISADSGTEVTEQVAKILGYEKTPLVGDPNWPMSASLWIHDDFDDGDWIYYMNTWRIYDQMELAGFSPIDTLFHRNGIDRDDVYDSVNEGKGIINFRGQAWINWLYPFDINSSYTNNGWRLPVVVSATCGTGNYESDGFVCENWQRAGTATNPEGSVAFFATNTAFPGSEGLSLRRGYVDEGFFDSVFETDDSSLGAACVAGRLRLHLKDEDQIDYEGWNLLGDPEMSVWTAAPFELSALFDGGTQIGPSDFAVTVLSGGALYEGARVACTKGDEVLSVGYSDVNGHVSLPIAPTTTGTMKVTITDKNAVPFQGDALVLDSGPFVVYSDVAIEDSSAGNDDGQLNKGETTELDVALSNIGDVLAPSVTARLRTSDPAVTITDSLASYGDLTASTTEWGTDTFGIIISPTCENRTLIPYSVVVFIDGTEAGVLNPPPLEVVTAEVAHSTTVTEDDGAGGDGDGVPDAGETVGLVLTLANDGPSALEDVHGTLSTSDPRIIITNPDAFFGDLAAGGTCVNDEVSFVLSISPTATSGHIVTLSLDVTGDGFSYQYAETVEFEIVLLGASIAAPLGPDAYGYYAYDRADSAYGPAPGFDWFDIAPPGPGNLVTAITDEDAGVTTMGMFTNIRYYGAVHEIITVNSNGYLAPGATDYRFGDNSEIPDVHGPPNMIAPFWDDLDPSASGDIYSWWDLTNHRLIFQFDEVPIWNTSNTQTFQVIFYDEAYYPTPTDDTQILFLYESVSLPYGCTVGIESPLQDDGIQWLHNGTYAPHAAPVEDGAAILFTTIAPSDPDVTWLVLTDYSIDDSAGGNGDGLAQIGETIELTVEFSSEGGTSASDVSVVLSSGESAVTVMDGTAAIPNIPAGGSRQNSDPLTFEVTQAISDTVATLWAQVTANGGDYTGAGRIDVRIDMSGTGIGDDPMPSVFSLRPGRPNPFAGDTRLQLMLPTPEKVEARVYNPAGRLVKTLIDAPLPAGEHFVPWDGTDESGNRVASGVYFVKLVAGSDRAAQKVVLLK